MATHTISQDGSVFFEQINTYLSKVDIDRVTEAFELARREHGEQRRKSGELFFTHPLTVAYYLSAHRLDAPALVAALLHDVAEDTRVSIEEIERQFGQEVALLVDGVTKLKDVTKGVTKGKPMSRQAIQDGTLRKLLAVMTIDVRTVIIKLFDRLHNLRTIDAMPQHKQEEKAKETLTVYAPLANRLGIWKVKNELELIAFRILHNQEHQILQHQLDQWIEQDLERIGELRQQIFNHLVEANIDVRVVAPVPKHVYDVYRDIITKGLTYNNINNTTTIKILLNDWPACYATLGHLHQLWKPVPDTFDDYIAIPRDNLYRSLHTTVVHSNGHPLKLQIRTEAMDKVSKVGVLTRWQYADSAWWPAEFASRVDTFFENIIENISLEPQNPSISVKGVVEDVFRKQIRVFTPRGQAVELAEGATPIDFAFAIHTKLGEQCHTAYVNDQRFPLNQPLKHGDQVRIVKQPRAHPQRAWLDEDLGYVTTNYARHNIRRWFRRLSEEDAIRQGQRLLQSELHTLGLPHYAHEKVAAFFEHEQVLHLYYRLGRAELLPTVVATRILQESWDKEPMHNLDDVIVLESGERFIVTHAEGRLLHLCGTCRPRPPEPILGYIRQDGTVTVHEEGCHTLNSNRASLQRLIKLGWGKAAPRQAHFVTLQVDVFDRPGLMFEIANLLHNEQINISYINTPPELKKGETRIVLTLEVVRPRHLVRVLHQIYALVNVYDVQVLIDGNPDSPKYLPPSLYRPE